MLILVNTVTDEWFQHCWFDQVCSPEEVKKCRWVIRNVSKQVDENVCTNVVRKVSSFLLLLLHVRKVGSFVQQNCYLNKQTYDSFSDVGESRVWFASKNLTPCRMH